jgi:hypothetical protein
MTNKMTRDENGLLVGYDYPYLANGYIDWAKCINSKYIVLFKDKKEEIEKAYSCGFYDLQSRVQSGQFDVDDKYKLVLLQGWRELATLRGYSGYEYTHFNSEQGYSSVACKIYWIANFESNNQPVFSVDGADAHYHNTYDFAKSYLTTIACNRAFARAVRSYLNISILAADEISDKKSDSGLLSGSSDESIGVPNPQLTLAKFVAANLDIKDFEGFKKYLRTLIVKGCKIIPESDFSKWKDYSSFEDIPKRVAIGLIGSLKGLNEGKNE